MEKILWCETKDIFSHIPTHRIWDACHLISYDFPIPMIFLPYEPRRPYVLRDSLFLQDVLDLVDLIVAMGVLS